MKDKKIFFISNILLVSLLVNACTKQPDFDSKSYVQSSLDAYYHGEYKDYANLLEISEKEAAKKDMESMLDYIDKLNELDTSNVEPMSHVFPVQNVFREDVVENGDGGEDTLANAPERRDRAFVVPKTVE